MSPASKSPPAKSVRPAKARTSKPPGRRSMPPKKSVPPAKARSIAPSAPKKRVLVVEDDAEIRGLLVRCLSARYHVSQAVDGFAAAEILGTLKKLDLLVCDVMMPRVDGISLARMIKADPELKDVPIIFLTAKNAADDVVKGIQVGARHYLSKPFSMKDLLEKVAKVLGSV